jgi:hypothetical protein
MYSAEQRNSSRFPEKPFDPKAVTRASWEPKPRKPEPEGPLVSFNRHPDAHMVLNHRNNKFTSMGPRTKSAIKWLRRIQLALRLLEMNGAIGIMILMILFTHVSTITHWVLRVAPGVVATSCAYAIFHLGRDANGRTPASSAAYHFFASLVDLCVLGLYAFGALTVHSDSKTWGTRLSDEQLVDFFVPAVYYTFLGAGGLHFISLTMSLWLGWAFRKITLMPPDMNPLEDNLTARPLHKRNKSSVATFDTANSDESEKRFSVLSGRKVKEDGFPQTRESIHFMHTRTQSRDSFASSSPRYSHVDFPSRQYQIVPGNSPRHSAMSMESKRSSIPAPGSPQRGSYSEVPRAESRDGPSTWRRDSDADGQATGQNRTPKFTETWKPTDSLISRTNQRNREMAASKTGRHTRATQSYSALTQRYDGQESDSEHDDENITGYNSRPRSQHSSRLHPNPLGSNPSPAANSETNIAGRIKTPFRPLTHSLTEISNNERNLGVSGDIAEERSAGHDVGLYSRPYGDLKSATPPIMIGSDRKVSSGNDYESKHNQSSYAYGRRNVSGKAAEEGRGGDRSSYYLRSSNRM